MLFISHIIFFFSFVVRTILFARTINFHTELSAVIRTLIAYIFNLDWEYPAFRDGGKPRDKDNYAQFVQELREEFEVESEKTGRPRQVKIFFWTVFNISYDFGLEIRVGGIWMKKKITNHQAC